MSYLRARKKCLFVASLKKNGWKSKKLFAGKKWENIQHFLDFKMFMKKIKDERH